jgi:hypothetical protein
VVAVVVVGAVLVRLLAALAAALGRKAPILTLPLRLLYSLTLVLAVLALRLTTPLAERVGTLG